ncbi:cation:proton antiporter [uncultured Thalassospira sp.]|jgi:NhaP-type Na+/H+ or K+/H+ antiporter|uniref:cation:proton antiporter n=1 Tax=uncultured Thalassospira sp. TaxID=404382 RepID=UPI0030D86BDA|tara:strand:+ start:8243 stop:9469 length:1227 start_codon:yes stop_codon:yes gene_type:complete
MQEWIAILFVASGLVYGLWSRRMQKFNISSPMMMVLAGAIVAVPLGLWAQAPLEPLKDNFHFARVFSELTLAIILFLDAAILDYRKERPALRLATRLLVVGLPLTILVTWVAAYYGIAPGIGIVPALLISLMVSPTDAALSRPVLENGHISSPVRQGINIESGLNDGLVLPVFTTALAIETALSGQNTNGWISEAILEILLGAGVGVASGVILGVLINHAVARNLMIDRFERLFGVLSALLIFLLAEKAGGNGFVAAFAGGLALNVASSKVTDVIESFGEAEAELLTMLTFFVFGLLILPSVYELWTAEMTLFAILSLLVLRPACVWICMIGSPYNLAEKLFIGWFGPRGIASIIYLLIMVTLLGISGYESLIACVALIVTISVIAHGISATPLSNALARYTKKKRPA